MNTTVNKSKISRASLVLRKVAPKVTTAYALHIIYVILHLRAAQIFYSLVLTNIDEVGTYILSYFLLIRNVKVFEDGSLFLFHAKTFNEKS